MSKVFGACSTSDDFSDLFSIFLRRLLPKPLRATAINPMAKILEMPKLSPTMEEGQISAWHKEEGEAIAVDDLLAEVETDKATMEYRSFDKGTLLKILVPAGSVVKLGQPVAVLGAPGEDIGALVAGLLSSLGAGAAIAAPATPVPAAPPTPITSAEKTPARTSFEPSPPTPRAGIPITAKPVPKAPPTPRSAEHVIVGTPSKRSAPPPVVAEVNASSPIVNASTAGSRDRAESDETRVKASPYVRKLARERGVNLSSVAGSGPGGRIVSRDLERGSGAAPEQTQPAALQSPAEPAQAQRQKPAPFQETQPLAAGGNSLAMPEARPLSMMRKAIARRLVESKQNVPHFYLSADIDADALFLMREQINADFAFASKDKDDQAPVRVSFNDLIIKACAIALTRVPECNAQFSPEAILIHRRVDISVAVAVPEGLVTPVVRDADAKSVLEIAAEVQDLAARARAKKLRPEEMANGTFSISNLGMYGIDSFAAVINPPEGAILAVGQVRREPVVKGDAVVPGRRMAMTLSCDHRVIDGAVGATFLKSLRQLLEYPTQILML